MPDGKSVVVLSTATGETEFWNYPANGENQPEQLTHNAKVLRWEGVPSPDGRWIAHRNKDQELLLRRNDDFYIFDSDAKAATLGDQKALAKAQIILGQWSFSSIPIRSSMASFQTLGVWSATTFITATCKASIGRRRATAICPLLTASRIATN